MFKHPRPILIVDDDVELVTLLVDYLQLEGFAPVAAHNGTEALELLSRQEFEIVVLDVMMPGMSGVEVLKRIREKSQLPVLMLTAKGDPVDRIIGLELGADDYVVKPFSMRELLARVKAVLRRSAKDSQSEKGREETLKIGGLRLDFSSYQAWLHDEPIALTPKEYELLKLLVTNPGRAFSRDELLERIWGYEYYGDTRTVDVHIRHLRAKLKGAPAVSDAIETVRGVGYRFARRTA